MTLVQLSNFVRIAELGSLSKAAAAIRIAQPALSRQIRQLETEMGTPLFVRHAWGVTLTPAGDALLDAARPLLRDADALKDAVLASTNNPQGRLALGVPASLAPSLLPPLAKALTQKYPDLRPHLVEGFSATLHARLISGDLDMAVFYDDRSLSALASTPLLTEELMLVSAVTVGSVAPPNPFQAGVLILPTRPNRLRLIIDEALARNSAATSRIVEVDSVPATIAMIQKGLGVTILPYSAVAADADRGTLRVWPLKPIALSRTLVLVRLREKQRHPAMIAVENELFGQVQALATKMRWYPYRQM